MHRSGVAPYDFQMNERALDLDVRDPLARFAEEFIKPLGQIYLDGNSLGLLCRAAEVTLDRAIDAWRSRAIMGWTDGPEPWFEMSRAAATRLAPILGAEPEDVMVGQSTTVNLHQLLSTFHTPDRRVVIDESSFPSDRYAVESHLRMRGQDPAHDLLVIPRRNELILAEDVHAALEGAVSVAILPSVDYRSGQLLEMANLTRQALDRGTHILWDCSHSAGVVDHRFTQDRVELAFGCTYKYLNGGPGSPGWLYVNRQLQDRLPGMAGWFGSDPSRQFEMAVTFHPAADAGRFLIGTPHILSLAPLLGALDVVNRAGMASIRKKSLELTRFLRVQVEERLTRLAVQVVTPRLDDARGGHLTLKHSEASKLSRALRSRGVIPDFRPPDLLRLAPSPLYTSFQECLQAVEILEEILTTRAHEQLPETDAAVT